MLPVTAMVAMMAVVVVLPALRRLLRRIVAGGGRAAVLTARGRGIEVVAGHGGDRIGGKLELGLGFRVDEGRGCLHCS